MPFGFLSVEHYFYCLFSGFVYSFFFVCMFVSFLISIFSLFSLWLFFFFFFFLSFLFLSRPCTRTHTRAVSHVHTYMHALTHSHQLSFSWVPGKGQEEGKLVGSGVGRRPHPTPLHVNLRALWSVLESSDLRAGQRQRNALPLPPFLSL